MLQAQKCCKPKTKTPAGTLQQKQGSSTCKALKLASPLFCQKPTLVWDDDPTVATIVLTQAEMASDSNKQAKCCKPAPADPPQVVKPSNCAAAKDTSGFSHLCGKSAWRDDLAAIPMDPQDLESDAKKAVLLALKNIHFRFFDILELL